MTRYIKTACLIVVVAIALVSAVFFSYKCIRQATADAAPEETTEMTEATETVPPETAATTVPTEETVPEETAAETTLPEETVPAETEAPKGHDRRGSPLSPVGISRHPVRQWHHWRPAEAASPRWLWSQPI